MIRNMRPVAEGYVAGWNLGAGASKVAAVDPGDPISHDDDTTYIEAVPANEQAYKVTPAAPDMVLVNTFTWGTRCRCTIGPTRDVELRTILNGSNSAAATFSPDTTWSLQTTTNRPGGGAWTVSDVSDPSLEGYIKRTDAGTGKMRCTSVWYELDFVAGGGTFGFLLSILAPFLGASVLLTEIPMALPLLRARDYLLSARELAELHRALRAEPWRRYAA